MESTTCGDNIPRLKVALVLLRLEFDQAREEQNHIAAFVHDGAVTVAAANLAWQLMLNRLRSRIVPLEVVVTVLEIDVVLFKNGSPLEGGS